MQAVGPVVLVAGLVLEHSVLAPGFGFASVAGSALMLGCGAAHGFALGPSIAVESEFVTGFARLTGF